ncbi:alpha/beta hydrolase fold domain-containing protein [Verrucomicrobiota bacterium sgz303538]
MLPLSRGFRSILLLLGFAASLNAQELAVTPERKDSASSPTTSSARELRDVPYVTNGHERQKLDLYLPAQNGAARPLVVWIHGGGWEGGSKNGCPAKAMVNRGYAVASIGYRLSQHAIYPAQIEDCKAAIRWLRAHAQEYAIDPARIGVWGASAGGHLAALLGTTGNIRNFDVGENLNESSGVQCVIDWFGPADFLHYGEPPWVQLDYPRSAVSKLLGGPVSNDPEKARRASPVYFVHAEAAPFLIMQGDKDPLVPLQQSELLQAALKKAGVESQLRIYPGAAHGGPAFSAPESLKLMTDFFDAHLGLKSAAVK